MFFFSLSQCETCVRTVGVPRHRSSIDLPGNTSTGRQAIIWPECAFFVIGAHSCSYHVRSRDFSLAMINGACRQSFILLRGQKTNTATAKIARFCAGACLRTVADIAKKKRLKCGSLLSSNIAPIPRHLEGSLESG